MPGAAFVDVDGGTLFGPPTGGSSMVEMNVGEEDLLDIAGCEAVFGETLHEGWDGGLGSGFDEGVVVAVSHEERRDAFGKPLKTQIEGVDSHNGLGLGVLVSGTRGGFLGHARLWTSVPGVRHKTGH